MKLQTFINLLTILKQLFIVPCEFIDKFISKNLPLKYYYFLDINDIHNFIELNNKSHYNDAKER